MIKLTHSKYTTIVGAEIQLIIPATQQLDFVIAELVSNGTYLAEIVWSAQYRQVYLRSVANSNDINYFSFYAQGSSNNARLEAIQPPSGGFWGASNGQIIGFCNEIYTIDPNYNIYKNGDILIVNNCTVSDLDYKKLVTFDMSNQFVGDSINGSNVLLIAYDSLG